MLNTGQMALNKIQNTFLLFDTAAGFKGVGSRDVLGLQVVYWIILFICKDSFPCARFYFSMYILRYHE